MLAIEVVFAATLVTDLLWSSGAALFILFVTYFGITAVGRLIHWRHNVHAERLLGATLAGATTSGRVTCHGDPVELVAGFHTEYSGMKFGMFMVGEYLGVILISSMIATIFFGGWLGPDFLPPIFWFGLKSFLIICFFVLLRAAIPRPRYDQLMSFGWKIMLPLTLINLMVTGAVALWLESQV